MRMWLRMIERCERDQGEVRKKEARETRHWLYSVFKSDNAVGEDTLPSTIATLTAGGGGRWRRRCCLPDAHVGRTITIG